MSISEYYLVIPNSEDTDEMLHYAAFHQGLHCLQKDTFRSHWYKRVRYMFK